MKSTRKSDYDSPFAKKLRDLLEKKSISKTKLASELGVKQQTVSQWSDGYTTPELKHLKPLASYFGISIDELVTGLAPDNEDIHLDTGLSNSAIEILKKLSINDKDKFENNLIIEFLNIIIERMHYRFNSLSQLSCQCMEYIIGAHIPMLEQENLIKEESKKFEIFCHRDRPNLKNDDLDFKTYRLTKDFEYFIEHLTKDREIADRVKTIYGKFNVNTPDYSDRRFSAAVFDENE